MTARDPELAAAVDLVLRRTVTVAEAAEQEGVSPASLRSRVSRGRQRGVVRVDSAVRIEKQFLGWASDSDPPNARTRGLI